MTKKEIKSARTRLGFSQSQLAEILGTHAMTVSKWETGERSPDSSAIAAVKMLVWAKERGELDDLIEHLSR